MKLSSHGSGFCPRFWRASPALLAADGAQTQLTLIAENLPSPRPGQLGFQCLVKIEGAAMLVGARATGEPGPADLWGSQGPRNHSRRGAASQPLRKVVCDSTAYRYEASADEYEAQVTLIWNTDHVVDQRPLVLYKCGVLGAYRGHQDCSLCVTRPSKFRCTWCGSACRYAPECPAPAPAPAQPLMHSLGGGRPDATALSQCPTPRIDVVSTGLLPVHVCRTV